jgi:2-oxoglutarate dehydrogenase complex dehydrogenase (E1) component-like enzyme
MTGTFMIDMFPTTDVLSADEYAVAWGLVYELLHGGELTTATASADRLQRYLQACRDGTNHLKAFLQVFTSGNDGYDAWRRVWMRQILALDKPTARVAAQAVAPE